MGLNVVERATLALLRRSGSAEAAVLGLQRIERRFPAGAEGLAKALELAQRGDWPSRYLGGKLLGRFFEIDPERVISALAELAEDPDRFVREGSAFGFGGACLSGGPAARRRLSELARSGGPAQRRAIAFSIVWLVRNSAGLRLDDVAALLEDALLSAGPKDTRQIGRQVVGAAIADERPEMAMALAERWALSENPLLQAEAARALDGLLRERFPERVAGVEKLLGAAEAQFPADSRGIGNVTGYTSTAAIEVPGPTIDQVIGQDEAVELVRIAARQKRFLLLVGEPGTGKSMLARAMSEMLPAEALTDILVLPNRESRVNPRVEEAVAGEGARTVAETRRRQKTAETSVGYVFWTGAIASSIISSYFALTTGNYLYLAAGAAAIVILLILRRLFRSTASVPVPKLLVNNDERASAPFVDATGFHAGALLGDVRHDPFQSGGYETPPHQLVEAGAIHVANRGVLFVDEVSTLGIESQQSLLTAIQEKRFPISGRSPGSSGSMVRTGPVACDFVLVIAGNMDDVDKMHPALRSRIRGAGYEVYLNESMDDTPANRAILARFVAQEVTKDGRIPHFSRAAVDAVVEEGRRRAGAPGKLTLRLRELGGLIRAAGDQARVQGQALVEPAHVVAAIPSARSLEEQIAARDGGSHAFDDQKPVAQPER